MTQPLTAYLVDAVTRERMEFQYNPSDITDSQGATYATTAVPGMSHPHYQYVSGEARKIAFTAIFYGDDVEKKANWLRSLLYPTHTGKRLTQSPHTVLFFFGELYPGTPCLVREVRARYSYLFAPETLLPRRADVEITLEEVVTKSVNAREVRR